jgi:hypothetical protein
MFKQVVAIAQPPILSRLHMSLNAMFCLPGDLSFFFLFLFFFFFGGEGGGYSLSPYSSFILTSDTYTSTYTYFYIFFRHNEHTVAWEVLRCHLNFMSIKHNHSECQNYAFVYLICCCLCICIGTNYHSSKYLVVFSFYRSCFER